MTIAALGPVGLVLVGVYRAVRRIFAHEYQPSFHPNGRCAICGLDHQKETR